MKDEGDSEWKVKRDIGEYKQTNENETNNINYVSTNTLVKMYFNGSSKGDCIIKNRDLKDKVQVRNNSTDYRNINCLSVLNYTA